MFLAAGSCLVETAVPAAENGTTLVRVRLDGVGDRGGVSSDAYIGGR